MMNFMYTITKYSGLEIFFFKHKNRLSINYSIHIFIRSLMLFMIGFLLISGYDFVNIYLPETPLGSFLNDSFKFIIKAVLVYSGIGPVMYAIGICQGEDFSKMYIRRFIILVYSIILLNIINFVVTL